MSCVDLQWYPARAGVKSAGVLDCADGIGIAAFAFPF
jgi:hypothetical protein